MGKKLSVQDGMNAIIYARYSSHAQKDASIEQQVDACNKYAAENGFAITHIYADRAVTGKTDRRVDFQRMMRDAGHGKFKYVIAWKSNRMGRNMLDALLNEAKLQDCGVRVLYTEEDFDDTAAGRFALRSMMNVNQFYSENMAEDIMRGMQDNAHNCKVNNGLLPLGYCKGADGKYAIVPEEADVVREIYAKFLEDVPLIDIANELNARGISTKTGGRWNKNSFSKMLSNERYIGVYIWADIRIENGIPKIIEKEMFDAVQAKLSSKKNPRGRHREAGDYVLTGKLFCGKCGSLMTGMSGTSGTGSKHYYYACQTVRASGSCDKKAVRRDWLELLVAKAICDYVLRDDVIEWMVNCCMGFQKDTFENQQIVSLRKQQSDIAVALKNVMNAIEQGIITDTTKERLVELEAEKKSTERSISELTLNLKPYDEAHVLHYLDSFRDGDINDKGFQRRLFDQFVSAVYLYDDEVRITFSGSKTTHRIPIETVQNAEELADSSVRLSSPMLHHLIPPELIQFGWDYFISGTQKNAQYQSVFAFCHEVEHRRETEKCIDGWLGWRIMLQKYNPLGLSFQSFQILRLSFHKKSYRFENGILQVFSSECSQNRMQQLPNPSTLNGTRRSFPFAQ